MTINAKEKDVSLEILTEEEADTLIFRKASRYALEMGLAIYSPVILYYASYETPEEGKHGST